MVTQVTPIERIELGDRAADGLIFEAKASTGTEERTGEQMLTSVLIHRIRAGARY